MNKKVMFAIAISIIVIIGIILIVLGLKNKEKTEEDKDYVVNDLSELFPSDKVTQTFKDGDNEYEVTVKSVTKKDDVTTIVSEYEYTINGVATTVETTYEITNEKVTESGKYTAEGSMVSIIYPTELIVGVPYVNMTWKSVDGLITNTVTSMKNNQVTIESVKKIDIYEEGKTTPTSKDFKETRIYEKGKGIVLYRTETVGDESSINEKKLID